MQVQCFLFGGLYISSQLRLGFLLAYKSPHNINAATFSLQGPLKPFADQLLGIINETGKQLEELSCTDFADLLRPATDQAATAQSCDAVVDRLSSALPGFNDSEDVNGQQAS